MRRLDGGMTRARSVDGLSMCECTGTVSDHVSVPYLTSVSAGISVSGQDPRRVSTRNTTAGESAGIPTRTRACRMSRGIGPGNVRLREGKPRGELVRCRRKQSSKPPSSIDGVARSPENGRSHRLKRPPRAPRSVRAPSPSPRRKPTHSEISCLILKSTWTIMEVLAT